MRKNVHIIVGLNKDSVGPAKYLQNRNEIVYIMDYTVKGLQKKKGYTFIGQAFVDSIDHTLFKVYFYEPPYKRSQIQNGNTFSKKDLN